MRPSGKGNSNSLGARPAHLIISTITWIRTSRLSIKRPNLECLTQVLQLQDGLMGRGLRVFRDRLALPSLSRSRIWGLDPGFKLQGV